MPRTHKPPLGTYHATLDYFGAPVIRISLLSFLGEITESARRVTWRDNANVKYVRWREKRNRMANESRRINRGR
jgi:hypothetical protein